MIPEMASNTKACQHCCFFRMFIFYSLLYSLLVTASCCRSRGSLPISHQLINDVFQRTMRILWLVPLVTLLGHAAGARHLNSSIEKRISSDLQSVFTVIDETTANGGCHGHMTRLETTYNEVMEMIDGAIRALNNLQRPRPKKTQQNRDDYNEYMRQAQVVRALFGPATISSGGLDNTPTFGGTAVLGTCPWMQTSLTLLMARQQDFDCCEIR